MPALPVSPETPVYVAGHRGMVGSAIVRRLLAAGHRALLTPSRDALDLCDAAATRAYLAQHRPGIVIIAAAKVGGIHANHTYPAEFLYENLAIASNLIHGAHLADIPRVLFLGSSCIYPREAPQPIREEALLTSPLEPTNEPYAIAKIAGLKLCESYRRQYGRCYHSLMPCNLYGTGDNYHPENSHVLPALIRRIYEATQSQAPQVTIWGTGKPLREFLHVDDLADATLHALTLDSPPDWLNVGSGTDITIRDLAGLVAKTLGYPGSFVHDTSKPDGTPRKLLDISRLRATGWQPRISLPEGLARTCREYIEHHATLRH